MQMEDEKLSATSPNRGYNGKEDHL